MGIFDPRASFVCAHLLCAPGARAGEEEVVVGTN